MTQSSELSEILAARTSRFLGAAVGRFWASPEWNVQVVADVEKARSGDS